MDNSSQAPGGLLKPQPGPFEQMLAAYERDALVMRFCSAMSGKYITKAERRRFNEIRATMGRGYKYPYNT